MAADGLDAIVQEQRNYDLHLRTVTADLDNENKAFQAYMKAQDRAYESFMTALRTGAKITGGN